MGVLLLRGIDSRGTDRRRLTEDEERAVVDATSSLVMFTASPASAAVIHEQDGGRLVGWDRSGASRLAQSLPPAFAELSSDIAERQRDAA
jgi:hypothetical protein